MQSSILENVWIPLSDGRRLAARIWLPPEEIWPVPGILEYLPYRKRDGTAARDATTYPVFCQQGYAGIRVDIAGTGESDGVFDDEYSERELRDGEEVIAWIAGQAWCSGRIGMIGISWGGFNGLQLAFRRPEGLDAVVSVCSTVDRYADDIHYMGGCLLTDNFNWGAQMTAYLSRPPDPHLRDDWRQQWLTRIETMPFLAAHWLRHPARGAYWRHGSVCEDWQAIAAPTLAIGGWADAYVNAPMALAENLSAPAKALIGPWEHKYPHIARTNPADFHGEVIGWFDRWLKGIDNGADRLPSVRTFEQVHDGPGRSYRSRSGRWIAQERWPATDGTALELRLTSDGKLDTGSHGMESGLDGPVDVATKLVVGRQAAYFCPGMRIDNELSGDQAPDDRQSVCFDLAPLESDLPILGRPEVAFDFSVDRPVAQLCFRLCDVSPDGVSQRVTYRTVNLTHHSGPDAPEVLVPGRRYQMVLPLNACCHLFRAGHVVRLAVSSSYWPVVWPSPAMAVVSLHLDRTRLRLPVRSGETTEVSLAAPRTFPTIDTEIIRQPKGEARWLNLPDGTDCLETLDDFGMARDRSHGLITGSRVTQRFSIREDDPLSACHQAEWRFEFRRDGWRAEIVSESKMSSDAENFFLERRISAFEGGRRILERQCHEEVARGLL